jgi:hypothetical protein
MSLRDLLTKPLGINPPRFYWREPMAYRTRLRGDGWLRWLIVLGAWALATGVLAALFAENIHQPSLWLAAGLGLVPAGMAFVVVFLRRDHVSGRVFVEDDEIRRYRSYGSLSPESWAEWETVPFRQIRTCEVIRGSDLGTSFSVLMLTLREEQIIVGVPASVELSKLAGFLKSKGVAIRQADEVPAEFRSPLAIATGATVAILGGVGLAGGLLWFQNVRGGAPAGPVPIAEREGFNPFQVPGRGERVDPVQEGHGGQLPPGVVHAEPVPGTPAQGAPPAFPVPSIPRPNFGRAGPVFGAPPGVAAAGPVPANQASLARSRKTDVIGVPGGFDFTRTQPDRRPVRGFRSVMGSWAGNSWVSRFEPVFADEPTVPGMTTIVARDGYVVSALLLEAPEFVSAYAVEFVRQNADGTLDADDHYTSEWVGRRVEGTKTQTLAGDGHLILGAFGRAGAVLNAVGLIVESD